MEQRFVKFNGGFSQDQLDWLEGVLSLADNKLERVTIVSKSSHEAYITNVIAVIMTFEIPNVTQ